MASFLYDLGRQKFAAAGIDWVNDTIHAYLVDTGYTEDQANHEFLVSVPGGNRVAGPLVMTSKTNVGGVCDADDAVFNSVSGSEIKGTVLVKDVTDENDSPLIAFIDHANITPNGDNVTIIWDENPATKIFKL